MWSVLKALTHKLNESTKRFLLKSQKLIRNIIISFKFAGVTVNFFENFDIGCEKNERATQ